MHRTSEVGIAARGDQVVAVERVVDRHAELGRADTVVGASAHLLRLDEQRREASIHGDRLSLTDAEFLLLREFMVHAGTMLSRDALSLVLTGRPFDGIDRTIDQYVSRLRRKLGDSARSPRVLKTVRGVGYLLAVGEDR